MPSIIYSIPAGLDTSGKKNIYTTEPMYHDDPLNTYKRHVEEFLPRVYARTFEPLFFAWLDQLNAHEKPFYPCNAFHFGLFEAQTEDIFVVYLVGTPYFDRDQDIDNEWIRETTYEPGIRHKFFAIPFTMIDSYDWMDAHYLVSRGLRAYLSANPFVDCMFHNAERITMGFDDGEVYKIK